jgi:hypothetical protein
VPLPSAVTDDDRAAHRAFIATLGDNASGAIISLP